MAAGVPKRCIEDLHVATACLAGQLRIMDSESRLGPLITCQAAIVPPELKASVVFRDRPRVAYPFADEIVRLIDLVRTRERAAPRPMRPVRGLPGRSTISLRLVDQEGWTVAEEQMLGECTDGLVPIRMSFVLELKSMVWFAARDWSERGPRISVSSEVLVPRGVSLRIAFRPFDADRGMIGQRTMEVPVIRPGMAWYTAERTIEGGSPDHAWVLVRFLDRGAPLVGGEHLVGHCQPVHARPPGDRTH
jgi:hypothetical protein